MDSTHTSVANKCTDDRVVLRNVRETLVELFIALARLVFFWIPGGDQAKGKALMTFHPIFIGACIAIFFLAPTRSPLRFFLVLLSIVVVASQWLLGGCVVTRAEQRLTGSKETMLDPFLVLAHLPVNRDTRIAATIASGTSICAILIWAYTCDFLHII